MAEIKSRTHNKNIVQRWVETGVLTETEHTGIMNKVGVLMRENRRVPLQYSLYRELAMNNGELPEHLIDGDTVVRQKKTSIEQMVPDIAATIHRLEEAALTVITDPQHELADATIQRSMAQQMARTIRNTYPANAQFTETVYPLKEGVADAAAKQMANGTQDTFAVLGEDGMMGVFCTVRKQDVLNRPHLIELGRTGVDERYKTFLKEKGLNMRGVSQLRLLQIFFNKEYRERFGDMTKAVYSDMRIKAEDSFDQATRELLVPSGRGVQSVFFGGINREDAPVDLGMGVWGVGWPYDLAGLEPFLRNGQWLDQEKFLAGLQNETIWVPNEAAQYIVRSYLSSFTPDTSVFNIRVVHEHKNQKATKENPSVSLTYNGNSVFSAIDVIDATEEVEKLTAGVVKKDSIMPLDEAIRKAYEGGAPFIETYVECTTSGELEQNQENISRLSERMQTLIDYGFVVTGFTPSDKGNGGIRLTFSLITKHGFAKGLHAHHLPKKYYSGNRMEGAIAAAEWALENLKSHSENSVLNA